MLDFTKTYARIVTFCVVLAFCFVAANEAYAVPATSRLVKVMQDDGSTLSIQLNGDEYFNWRTTEDGYAVAKENGYYYYVNYTSDGKMELSGQRVMVNGARRMPDSSIKKPVMGSIVPNVTTPMMKSRALSDSSDSGFPSHGDVKSVVILVQYYDVKFTVSNPNEAFTNQLNEEGYSVEGAVGSARDYFYANSGGQFRGQFDVYGPYTLNQPQVYYGGNDIYGSDLRGQEMIKEAVELADKDGVDFSQYDLDGDGKIDNVFVYYAGRSEAEGGGSNCIWPHKWNVASQPSFDGKILDVYACTSELRGSETEEPIIAGIGTFCHEFSHVFGLADHYDTTGDSDGTSYGMGNYDLMTSGSYNNDGNTPPLHTALERMMIGWLDPEELDSAQDITLAPISEGKAYMMSTDIEGEFFLFENRNPESSIWEQYIPGSGLMISHVDQSSTYQTYWDNNYPNGNPSHECYRYIIASNVACDYYTGWDGIPYPFVSSTNSALNNNEWTPNSTPKSTSWSRSVMPYQLTDIAKVGQNVTFTVSEAQITPLSGTVTDTYGNGIASAMLMLTHSSGAPSYPGVTDELGNMVFYSESIDNGTYTLTVTADGYADYSHTFELAQGEILDVVLFSEAQNRMVELKYHNSIYSHGLGSYDSFRPMMVLTADMLKEHVGRLIEEVRYYVVSPFEGQIIIQPALTGSGWGSEVFVLEEGQVGWKTASFIDQDIMIEPNTDYYVKVMVMTSSDVNPAIGMDTDTSGQYYGYSNLVDMMWGDPLLVNEASELDGNLMISLALSEECAYVAPESFNIMPSQSEGISLSINEVVQINWTATPANGNAACNWESTNSDVVTVSSSGAIFGVGEGVATVIGRSVLDPSVQMVIDVEVVEHEARGKGRVVKFNTEEGVGDITLQLYAITPTAPVSAPSAATIELLKSSDLTQYYIDMSRFKSTSVDDEDVITVVSDQDGYYSVEGLLTGCKYQIVLTQTSDDPWTSRSQVTSTIMGAYIEGDDSTINDLGNFALFENDMYGAKRYSYYEGSPDLAAFGDNTTPLMYAIKFPASSLVESIGEEITFVDAVVSSLLDAYIEAYIYSEKNGVMEYVAGACTPELSEDISDGIRTFQFVNQDAAIIRPETDYYACIKMMGYMGTQIDPDNMYDGLGNLMWYNDRWVTLNEMNAPYYANWQIAMYTHPREIEPVTAIAVAPAVIGTTPYVGVDYALSASVYPATAVYDTVEWSSSDEEVATIDQKGNLTILKEGEVTFRATSVTYPDVYGEYTADIKLLQGVSGAVINSDGNRVSNATVHYYPTVMTQSKVGALQKTIYTRVEGSEGYSVESDAYGEYYIDLEPGVYEVEVKYDGLIDYQAVESVEYGMNYSTIVMYLYVEALSDFLSWSVPQIDGAFGDESYNFVPFTRWDSSTEMPDQVGRQITRLKALVIGGANIRFVIFTAEADKYLYYSDLIEVPADAVQMVVHDLDIEDYVTIEAGKEYCIGYEVSNYYSDYSPAVVSIGTATVAGRSDCIIYRNEPTDLTTLIGEDSGSWVIGFYTQDEEQIKGLNVTVGQNDAVATWNPASYEQFRLTYGIDGGSEDSVDLTDCKYEFTSLESNTKYNIKIEASEDGENYVELLTSSFTTLDKLSTIPLVMLEAYDGYVAGEILNLKSLNTVSTDSVVWYVDGEQLPRSMIILEAGKHKIQCRVTRGAKSYVTTRYINVVEQ
ncbi:MAG: M6 family metalloprotease domain-containing protein [Rikenellaceae bacterium]